VKQPRTWLFVPGDDAHKLAKALASVADAVVIDWEDAVAAERREAAVGVTRTALEGGGPRRLRVGLRIRGNDLEQVREDLAAASGLPVDFLMLPKAEEAETIREVGGFDVPIVVLLESARGVERASALAAAHPGVERFAFGHVDFLADCGAMLDGSAALLDYARSRIVVAGKASGLQAAVDSIHPVLGDLEGLRAEARRARSLGFGGKLAIHPSQLEPIRDAFQPDEEEIAFARRVVEVSESSAIAVVDGFFVDKPLLLWARSVLGE